MIYTSKRKYNNIKMDSDWNTKNVIPITITITITMTIIIFTITIFIIITLTITVISVTCIITFQTHCFQKCL